MRARSLLRQNGQVNDSNFQRSPHRPQIRWRSAVGVMTASSGSPPHKRAMRMSPECQLGALLQHLRAARQKRTHGERQDLVVGAVRRRRLQAVDRATGVATCRLHPARYQSPRTATSDSSRPSAWTFWKSGSSSAPKRRKDVGRLAHGEPQFGELERDVLEPEERACFRLMGRNDVSR